MTAVRPPETTIMESSDSSDCSLPNEPAASEENPTPVPYRPGPIRCGDMAKIDAYNNNQLLLPAQFYKTLLAKAVLGSGHGQDDNRNVYKNMLFHAKEREFEQVRIPLARSGRSVSRNMPMLSRFP